MQTITIVGGNGGMGQLFKKLWQSLCYNINILDKDNWAQGETYLPSSDLVVISVPISVTNSVIQQVCPYINKNTILADFTSTKVSPIKTMLEYHEGSVIGLHPMFGPTIESPADQTIINCGGRDLGNCAWVFASLNTLKFKIVQINPDEHDKYMNFIQGIEHFSTFSLGNFLKIKEVHPENIFDIASPIYQLKLSLLGRIFDQEPKLYADIVMSDFDRIKLIDEYINYLISFKEMLKTQDKEKFIEEFTGVSKWLGNFTQKSQDSTDKILANLSQCKN